MLPKLTTSFVILVGTKTSPEKASLIVCNLLKTTSPFSVLIKRVFVIFDNVGKGVMFINTDVLVFQLKFVLVLISLKEFTGVIDGSPTDIKSFLQLMINDEMKSNIKIDFMFITFYVFN
jgi:hypothetical protein